MAATDVVRLSGGFLLFFFTQRLMIMRERGRGSPGEIPQARSYARSMALVSRVSRSCMIVCPGNLRPVRNFRPFSRERAV